MATLVFDGGEDSVAEARLLVECLSLWLQDQPVGQPVCGSRAQFCYRPDGTLDSVLTVPVGEDE